MPSKTIDIFNDLYNSFRAEIFRIINPYLEKVIKDYDFVHISDISYIKLETNVEQNIQNSKIIIIDQYEKIDKVEDQIYFFIIFHKTIIFLNESCILFLKPFLCKSDVEVYFSDEKTKSLICQKIENKCKEIEFDLRKEKYIETLKSELNSVTSINKQIKEMWSIIVGCISRYFIKQCFNKFNKNRIDDFLDIKNELKSTDYQIFDKNEYIALTIIGSGFIFNANLVYHIEKEELYIIKNPRRKNSEISKLIKREYENYSKLNYSFIPKFIGKTKNDNFNVIEYIEGKTLDSIKSLKLSIENKITMIFEIMITIQYFHENHFVLRDLKPDNIMVDNNKNIVIIDFDRMVQIESINKDEIFTNDFSHDYVAPEVNFGKYSYECDIYSLGMIILYMITENEPEKSNEMLESEIFDKFPEMKKMIRLCISEKPDERPKILELVLEFYYYYNEQIIFHSKIESNQCFYQCSYQNDDHKTEIKFFKRNNKIDYINSLYTLGNDYYMGKKVPQDINKAIHFLSLAANKNHPLALSTLASIYYDGKYITRNINKSIEYWSLAANQNFIDAYYYLGLVYYLAEFVPRDISKFLYYLTYAADNYCGNAQNELGKIYYEGLYIKKDDNISFYYFSLAAKQNIAEAQYNIGFFYQKGIGCTRDIKKAIYYYSLASKNNFHEASHNLALIYEDKYYGINDTNKAIHYYDIASKHGIVSSQYNLAHLYFYEKKSYNKAFQYYLLAANNGNGYAQLKIGEYYYNGKFVPYDVNKSIYYFTLAASKGLKESFLYLAFIYYNGRHIKPDINKSIHFFTLAAKENNIRALHILGYIYDKSNRVPRDINKSIKYYYLAAKLGSSTDQYCLGMIYEEINDIDKSIYYYSLASQKNNPKAQTCLGYIYSNKKFNRIDIEKAIFYYTLAANQNCKDAQFSLGVIYYDEYIKNRKRNQHHHNKNKFSRTNSKVLNDKKNMKTNSKQNFESEKQNNNNLDISTDFIQKSVYYFTLAANQNHKEAQFYLGTIYFEGLFTIKQNIIYGLRLLIRSAENDFVKATFYVGYLFHFGRNVNQDIYKAIKLYKNASSYNNQFAKNNLGIIYKNGFENKIEKNINFAIEYFKEAIRQSNDLLSLYNLAHIYMYEKTIDHDFDKSIELLIKTLKYNFNPLKELLCIALFKKYSFDIEKIRLKLANLSPKLLESIINQLFEIAPKIEIFEKHYENINFVYDNTLEVVYLNHIKYEKSNHILFVNNAKNISNSFYDGFGLDLV